MVVVHKLYFFLRGHSNNTKTLEGGSKKCHTYFFTFEMLLLTLLGEKLFVTKQDEASKNTVFLIHLKFKINLGLKISHQKLKNVT